MKFRLLFGLSKESPICFCETRILRKDWTRVEIELGVRIGSCGKDWTRVEVELEVAKGSNVESNVGH